METLEGEKRHGWGTVGGRGGEWGIWGGGREGIDYSGKMAGSALEKMTKLKRKVVEATQPGSLQSSA